MNITFNDAALFENDTGYKYFETLFLPARMIRDVIIPDNVKVSYLKNKNYLIFADAYKTYTIVHAADEEDKRTKIRKVDL